MRILTVRQPWAYAIIHGGKDVENRVRNIAGSYRGPVAIHAAAAWDWDVTYPVGPTPHPTSMSLIRGAIIGVVDLIDVHYSDDCYQANLREVARLFRDDRTSFKDLPVRNVAGGLTGRAGFCSDWAQDESHHLVLANPRPLSDPIPYKGALGLRRLDFETIALIESRLS